VKPFTYAAAAESYKFPTFTLPAMAQE
jgi:hypothetical protein